MRKSVSIEPLAKEDIRYARRWYRRIDVALGNAFMDELTEIFSEIEKAPKRFPHVTKGCRRALLSRFPYKVLFREGQTVINVLAVYHAKRNPDDWIGRAESENSEE